MTFRFDSVPLNPAAGSPDPKKPVDGLGSETVHHELTVSWKDLLITPFAVSMMAFAAAFCGGLMLIQILQQTGLGSVINVVSQICLWAFATCFCAVVFISTIFAELGLRLRMKVLADRQCDWGEFQIACHSPGIFVTRLFRLVR